MATHTTAGVRLRTRDLTYIALFAVLMAVCAWISIPVTAVSFTLQTFAIFAALMILGGRRGTYAVAAYLLLGAVGPCRYFPISRGASAYCWEPPAAIFWVFWPPPWPTGASPPGGTPCRYGSAPALWDL